MYDSALGESGRAVLDEPETSVTERRCKKPSRYIVVFSKADRLWTPELRSTPFPGFFIKA
jgi:hypothetical protein